MPISRIVFNLPFRIGSFYFFPPGSLDIISLNPLALANLEKYRISDYEIVLNDNGIRWAASAITKFDINTLEDNPLVVFPFECDWRIFLTKSHEDDIELINELSSEAERPLDLIRYKFCRFDLPDTLPGAPGSWEGSGQFLGAMLHDPIANKSYLVAGAAVESIVIVKGLGLEVDTPLSAIWIDPRSSELSGIITHALSLYSDVMYASSETTRYARAMTLLEFLGSPDEYKTWKKLKSEIICHLAADKAGFHRLVERFKELTNKEDDNDTQTGFRTLIVHHGKFLHELIPSQEDRKRLFKEIQRYAARVLEDMIDHRQLTWSAFQDYRSNLKRNLGVLP